MKAAMSGAVILLALAIGACRGPSPDPVGSRGETAGAQPVKQKPAVELPSGLVIKVRVQRALSTVRDRAGDKFEAILDESVIVDDSEVLARGTRFTGHVTTSKSSGRLEGRAVLGVTLDSFETEGRQHAITTSSAQRMSEAHKKRNVEFIGGGTGVGALVGGLTGGAKGAGIGAAVGAGAGTAAAAATGKKDLEIPAETRLQFSLKESVKI